MAKKTIPEKILVEPVAFAGNVALRARANLEDGMEDIECAYMVAIAEECMALAFGDTDVQVTNHDAGAFALRVAEYSKGKRVKR